MTHPNDVMTAAELARVVATVKASQTVYMHTPDRSKVVPVAGHRVEERRAAGYQLIEEN